jgi:hypothetical protein
MPIRVEAILVFYRSDKNKSYQFAGSLNTFLDKTFDKSKFIKFSVTVYYIQSSLYSFNTVQVEPFI